MVVVESTGSSPGKQGFSMVVCEDGSLSGSIGGGAMEYKLVEECKTLLDSSNHRTKIHDLVHNEGGKDSTGMLCSGKQKVILRPIGSSNIDIVNDIIKSIDNNNEKVLCISNNNISIKNTNEGFKSFSQSKDQWEYCDIIGTKNTLYIVGSGHVGYAVSKLFSILDFHVVLFDNRQGLPMFENNNLVDEKRIIDYSNVHSNIGEGDSSFVVIMTSNHTHDMQVLKQLLGKNLKYLGLLGSKAKVSKFKKQLTAEGVDTNRLDALHAPIGIDINSITPDEIAISIAADIINVKNL